MEHELGALENKLTELIKFSSRLRTENHRLRQELAIALSQNRQNNDKMDAAKIRLERLLHNLPAEVQ